MVPRTKIKQKYIGEGLLDYGSSGEKDKSNKGTKLNTGKSRGSSVLNEPLGPTVGR